MPRFRLLPGCGKHTTKDGKVISKPGAVFEEDVPLDEIHANKFERLDGKTAKMPDSYNGPGADEVMDDSLLQRQRKKAVRDEEKPTPTRQASKFKKAVISDDEDEHSVEKVGEGDGEEHEDETDDTDEDETDAEDGEKDDDAEDVTAKYPKAKDGGLQVLKAKNGFHVVDGDGEYLNEKPLKHNQVAKVIAENVKSE